jgi:DNA-binding transcriptional LysR family regulator
MLPSAAELEYFIEVSNTLNLSRASERLGISQPSLSLAIKRLEHSIGTQLLVRHKNGVTLTQAGKQLLFHAKQLLQYWANTKSQALASHQEVQGYFTLGCHPTIAIYMVSGFLADLLENHPKLEIHLKHDISRKITEQVINLSLDIGLVINPLKHPDLIIQKLCDDEVTFWVGEGNRKIQDINSELGTIICDPDLMQTQYLLKNSKRSGIMAERIMTVNSLEVVANLIANGCGIGILPSRVAKSMYPDKIKRIPNAPVYSDELCLIYRNENRHVQAIQTIVGVIKDYYKTT